MDKHLDRFEAKFERVPWSGCWLWNAAIFPARGYGAFAYPGEQLAHRVAWILYRGPIPAGFHVLHSCDNQSCVNPDHLFLGDQVANMADKVRKGRQAKGEGAGCTKLTEAQVRAILLDVRTQAAIAAAYGVHWCTISDIKRRRTWKHLV